MDEELRSCRRTGCRWPAVASLSYRYDTRQVWLVDLAEPHPSLYELCPHHADTLTVPRGWERVDQRSPEPEAVVEPAGRDLVTSASAQGADRDAAGGGVAERPAGSRYSLLRADLPRLAAELAERRGGVALAEAPPGRDADERDELRLTAVRSVRPLPSRELSPLPAPPEGVDVAGSPDEARAQGDGPPTAAAPVVPSAATAEPGEADADELAGQLAIPVEDVRVERDGGHAVVVSLEMAGSRRRPE